MISTSLVISRAATSSATRPIAAYKWVVNQACVASNKSLRFGEQEKQVQKRFSVSAVYCITCRYVHSHNTYQRGNITQFSFSVLWFVILNISINYNHTYFTCWRSQVNGSRIYIFLEPRREKWKMEDHLGGKWF